METLAVTVPTELKLRLERLANETGHSLGECLGLAVREFVESWETHISDLKQADDRQVHAVLKAANE